MIGFVMIGTNNLGESSKFYDTILSALGIIIVMSAERNIGYAKKNTISYFSSCGSRRSKHSAGGLKINQGTYYGGRNGNY